MNNSKNTSGCYTPKQLKLPIEIERIIEISDPVVLFSFMKNGYISLRKIEKSYKTDIRYMWLLDEMKAPTFATIFNFVR